MREIRGHTVFWGTVIRPVFLRDIRKMRSVEGLRSRHHNGLPFIERVLLEGDVPKKSGVKRKDQRKPLVIEVG